MMDHMGTDADGEEIGAFDQASLNIVLERCRQHDKWGKQSHNNFHWLAILAEEFGEAAEAALHVNGEEFGKYNEDDLIAEVTQVAAVAHAWLEDLLEKKNAPSLSSRSSSPEEREGRIPAEQLLDLQS
jgi:hypothetical protein